MNDEYMDPVDTFCKTVKSEQDITKRAAGLLINSIGNTIALNRLLKRSAAVHFGSVDDEVFEAVVKMLLRFLPTDVEVLISTGKTDDSTLKWKELIITQKRGNLITVLGQSHKTKQE